MYCESFSDIEGAEKGMLEDGIQISLARVSIYRQGGPIKV